jgi:mannose/cellobiose epimerase-like protein (N-acyl-D-glucosamine 2-epimerase family)
MIEFSDRQFLLDHIAAILAFYEPVAFDSTGGFFQNFKDDGTVFDPRSRHLVSSTRFVFNYAEAYRRGLGNHYQTWAKHGVDYLLKDHLGKTGHFSWILGISPDHRALAYGHAFVMLAGASAIRADVDGGTQCLALGEHILETYFFESHVSAYADERSPDLTELSPYRGQNANMHACESMIASYHATGNVHYLERATILAKRFAGELADEAGGLVWEHYSEDWSIDWDFHRDKPNDLFKPWGFQPGHQVEWTKLLTELFQITNEQWYLKRAITLYERAIEIGWDDVYGGLVYGVAPDGAFASADKYFWVHAEAFAAAYRLFRLTSEPRYLNDYQRIWDYAWSHLVDHQHGAWFRVLTREGEKIDDLKSPMGKVDYHTLGACWDVLDQQF